MVIWIFVLYILAANNVTVPSWIFYASWIMLWLKATSWMIGAMKRYGKCYTKK